MFGGHCVDLGVWKMKGRDEKLDFSCLGGFGVERYKGFELLELIREV
jgi:hypothetical protein